MDKNKINDNFCRTLDDVRTCGRLARNRLHLLVQCHDDLRLDSLLWTWIRMRSYSRHAIRSLYLNNLDNILPDDLIKGELQPFKDSLTLEMQLKELRFFGAEWVRKSLERQIEERKVSDRISDFAELIKIWGDSQENDFVAEGKEIIRLRNEHRSLKYEFDSIFGSDDSQIFRPQLKHLNGKGVASSDSKLDDLINKNEFMKQYTLELEKRFYPESSPSNELINLLEESGISGPFHSKSDFDYTNNTNKWWF